MRIIGHDDNRRELGHVPQLFCPASVSAFGEAFKRAVMRIEKSALAAEAPDPKMKVMKLWKSGL